MDKPNAEADSRQRKAQLARQEVLKLSYFRIRVNDPRVIALWGKLKAETCALLGTDTFLSPPANKRAS